MAARTRLVEYILLIVASLASASATVGYPDCSDPQCLPIAVHDAPGVGFDLTAGYGVSSVNVYDGPTRDLVKVEAAQEYKDLIVRLSSRPPARPSYIGSLKRWWNKRCGRPSTPDVGIISDLIAQLKNATEAELGISLDKIVLSHLRFPALTAEDIGDAIEYAGLQSWLHTRNNGEWDPNQLSENRAALAAHGINLCQEYGSWQVCVEGISANVSTLTVYYASLTRSALYTSLDTYLQPFEFIPEHEPHFFDSALGLDNMPQFASEDAYWNSVRDKLVPPRNNVYNRPITHVIVGGEAAMMPEFRNALQEALLNASSSSSVSQSGAVDAATSNNNNADESSSSSPSPLYAAARGAALLARWRQEARMHCFEMLGECNERRRREREKRNSAATISGQKSDL
ncbi:hypothetical protein CKM354_000222900 [Cercospora kikuchii]|uniref:Uncharacterized protein n=1 Tax=Cercospora kikuchii TaxID=84275 RepID=A0A9P3C9L8_9PEZI|nr:uncharacterized protein CKM354_000222900 [Cercospora kikuchii]GIZ38828.1 hypothetical protein CKM354_000222900 [Cercospora kikuchii]